MPNLVPDDTFPCFFLTGLYSPPEVDGIWGIWRSYSNIPNAIFYLLKGDYTLTWFNTGKKLLTSNKALGRFACGSSG